MTDSPAGQIPADLIITGCTVLVHDAQERIGFEEDAAVVVRDGVVESVTTASAVAHLAAAERIDARGQVAMPGLINCHTHAPMVALRGVAEDLPTDEWFNDVVWPIESNLTEKDVELGMSLIWIMLWISSSVWPFWSTTPPSEVLNVCRPLTSRNGVPDCAVRTPPTVQPPRNALATEFEMSQWRLWPNGRS